ncbi:MAG: SgcJ/EcaC family oxidoreductase [Rhodospirillaceae bacterium]|nr:SgcJ/EcaC family oxidoreductase [Rhodospirillaceae bacterium]
MRLIVLCAAIAVLSMPAFAQTVTGGTAEDIKLLSARKQAMIDAYNKTDIDGVAANYTEDAWHVSPRRSAAVGRAAIAAYFEPAMRVYLMDSQSKVLNVDISGDTATMISENELKGSPRPGAKGRDGAAPPPFVERRTNLTVFKKQADGRWLIHRFFDTTPPEMKQ